MSILEIFNQFVQDLNSSNSAKDKTNTIRRYLNDYSDNHEFLDILKRIYSPYCTFGITSKSIEKCSDNQLTITDIAAENITDLLERLQKRELTGNSACRVVREFISRNIDYKDLILNIIDKDLKVRVGATLINKAATSPFIPEFNVALCAVYGDNKKVVDFKSGSWWASRKLDGCRCILRKENGVVTAWSRQGRQFETLGVLIDEFSKIPYDNLVLDGEICLIDAQGNEDFQGIMKQINRKNHTIKNPMYKVFDILTLKEFDSCIGERSFFERQGDLNIFFALHNPSHASINIQVQLHSEEQFAKLMSTARENNWEGLVIRKDVPYEGKRTKNMLKCKEFSDAEYVVLDAEVGPFQVIENGKAIEREVLTNVIIEHKGFRVSVGSGFSLEQRKYYKDHLSELIGKTITVQYFEETENMQGELSLRFPTVKYIYEGERNI